MLPKLHMDLLQLRTWPQIRGGGWGGVVLFSFFFIFLNAFSDGKYAVSTNYWFLRAMAACNANLGLCLCKLTWRDTVQSQAEAAESCKVQCWVPVTHLKLGCVDAGLGVCSFWRDSENAGAFVKRSQLHAFASLSHAQIRAVAQHRP